MQKDVKVLEIGCGLGTNAYLLASLGYNITAVDVSRRAIELAAEKYKHNKLIYRQLNFQEDQLNEKFDVVFDKGCFHSFTNQESYNNFAKSVSESLTNNGYWISIAGNADNPDDLEKRKANNYPRMSLTNIAIAVEPFFEVKEIRNILYGLDVRFQAWLGVYKIREYYYDLI